MTIFLFLVAVCAMAVSWAIWRDRFQDLEERLANLSGFAARQSQVQELTERVYCLERSMAELRRSETPAIEPVALVAEAPPKPAPPKPIVVEPAPPVIVPPQTILPTRYAPPEPARATPSSASRLRTALGNDEWEALVGGSLLNKVGAVVLVIGIALFLAYSFGRMQAGGRATLAIAASSAILGTGVWAERRAQFRIFARGLIGAGWAALYATAYAIYALPAARIIENPFAGSMVLLLVAAGMIAHSLRYSAQAVTATAYFAAFAALAATPSTPFAVMSLVPLAASLLFLANRFNWNGMALFGLATTYATCIARGSSNAPLASTQMLFLAYWLLFEAFDLLRVRKRVTAGGVEFIAALNAIAFLGLSYMAWSQKAPGLLWLAAAYGAALYLASAILRAIALPLSALPLDQDLSARLSYGSYEFSLILGAALAGLAIVGKVPGVWSSVGLAVEAELLYLAGIRFQTAFLRGCGMATFLFSLGRLASNDASYAQSSVLGRLTWNLTPPALFHAFLFYVNRVLKKPNITASSVAAALVAAVLAVEMPDRFLGAAWLLFAMLLLELGLRRRLAEFRLQAYILAAGGATASAFIYASQLHRVTWAGLAVSLALAYACALRSRWNDGALDEEERTFLAHGASAATAMLAAILLWNIVPRDYVSMAWVLLAALLFEAGNRGVVRELRTIAWAAAALGGAATVGMHASHFVKFAPTDVWAPYLSLCVACWAVAARSAFWTPANLAPRERAAFTDIMSAAGAFTAMAFTWLVLPEGAVSVVWAVLGVAVTEVFGAAGIAVLTLTLARALAIDLETPQRIPSTMPVIAAFYFRAYRSKEQTPRALNCVAGTGLLTALVYTSVSGSLFTVALGLEGLALLGAGFPLRERILRLQGLALLMACILKLFVYDLRNLETMYRILSFIALGLIMLGVSWIYTRFRDHVRRLL